jgi:hypothetical protein
MKRMGHYPEMGKGNQQQSSRRRLRNPPPPKPEPEKPLDFGFLSFPAEVQEEILAMAVAPELPQMGKAWDYIYPRCVWCRGENYALAVLAYSRGETPCAAVNGCGRYLPEDYRRPADEEGPGDG